MLRDILISASFPLLANTAQSEPPAGTGGWLLVLVYIGGIVFLALGIVEKVRGVFGRTPTIDHELRERNKSADAQRAELLAKIEELGDTQQLGREQDRIALYRTINVMRETFEGRATNLDKQCARLETTTEAHSQHMAHSQQVLESILQRLPRPR